MIDLIKSHWDNIFLALSAVAAWFTGRKIQASTNKEAEANAVGVELQNLKTVREVEKQLLEDMQENVTNLLAINTELKGIISQLETVIKESKAIISKQNKEIARCKKL
jgi:hypothetical protein